ncbi:ErpC protein [Borreliella carolinensis]|uniref:ErpC protein n=1 Tax=Borreliella carolinensis TaxID=478174 RepID=UPI003AF00067
MNKIIKILIIYSVFVLISSCKNYAIKDLEQKTKGQVNGFIDRALDPTKDKIASNGPIVDELAKKLQEEEKEELMQGDDPSGIGINPPLVLPENDHDNTPAPKVKAAKQSGGQQEKKVEDQNGEKKRQEQEEEKVKAKAEKEKSERQKRQQEEQQRKAKKEHQEKEHQKKEREKEREREREEEKQVKDKIKDFVDKIDKINRDIDSINPKSFFEERMEVSGQEVEDKVTGAIYDKITSDNSRDNSLYSIWDESIELDESGRLKNLIDDLEKARGELRAKIKEDEYDSKNNQKNKNIVKVGDIKSDLEKLKSKLDKVKEYLEDKDNFETIKGYIEDSNS